MIRVVVILLLLLLTSCGTLLNGPPYMVPVDSSPRGATVHYRGSAVGTTPCQVAMDGNCLELSVGGKSVEVDYSRNWVGTIGNAFLLIPGCFVGLAVDISTGAWRVPSSDGVQVILPNRNAQTQVAYRADIAAEKAAEAPRRATAATDTDTSPRGDAFCSRPGCRYLHAHGYLLCDTHLAEARTAGTPEEQLQAPQQPPR
jgi:hypothetical protein